MTAKTFVRDHAGPFASYLALASPPLVWVLYFLPMDLAQANRESLAVGEASVGVVGLIAALIFATGASVTLTILPSRWSARIVAAGWGVFLVGLVHVFMPLGTDQVLDGSALEFSFHPVAVAFSVLIAATLPIVAIAFGAELVKRVRRVHLVWLLVASVLMVLLPAGRWAASEDRGSSDGVGAEAAMRSLASFSGDRNVLVILMDAATSHVVGSLLDSDQELRDAFLGFRFYPDALSVSPTTHPFLSALHAGVAFVGQEPLREFTERKVRSESVFNEIASAGWSVSLLNPVRGLCPEEIQLCTDAPLSPGPLRGPVEGYARLADVGALRAAPYFLKDSVYGDGRWALQSIVTDPAARLVRENDFLERFAEAITVDADRPTMKYIHLFSTHPPFLLDDSCTIGSGTPGPGLIREQTRCAFDAIATVLRRLRELELDRQTAVLVVADHGTGTEPHPLMDPAEARSSEIEQLARTASSANPAVLFKGFQAEGEMSVADDPVQINDIAATLCDLTLGHACRNTDDASRSWLDEEVDADRERSYIRYRAGPDVFAAPTIRAFDLYNVTGPPYEVSSWSFDRRVFGVSPKELATRALAFDDDDDPAHFGATWEAIARAGRRWAMGPSSELYLSLPDEPVTLSIRLTTHEANAGQELTVRVNGVAIGTVDVPDAGFRTASWPVPEEAKSGAIDVLTFEASHYALHPERQPRPRSVLLESLELHDR